MSEADRQRHIWLAESAAGVTLWRNNVGVVREKDRVIRYGLCAGSSDLIGLTPITITADMVGKTVAVFTAEEVKRPTTKLTPKQATFCDHVRQQGGIAGRVTCAADAAELRSDYLKLLNSD